MKNPRIKTLKNSYFMDFMKLFCVPYRCLNSDPTGKISISYMDTHDGSSRLPDKSY